MATANQDYLTDEASARKSRRTSLAAGSNFEILSTAAGYFAAYSHIHSQYGLPHTAYLRGLAQVNVVDKVASANSNF